jgi:hypothetical protein
LQKLKQVHSTSSAGISIIQQPNNQILEGQSAKSIGILCRERLGSAASLRSGDHKPLKNTASNPNKFNDCQIKDLIITGSWNLASEAS